MYVHKYHLPLGFKSSGTKTIQHPKYNFWVGSPDNINELDKIVGDTKAYERKAFCEYADSILTNDITVLKDNHIQEYWQMVSNAAILGFTKIQPFLFIPYREELRIIRDEAEKYDGADQWKYKFIFDSEDNQLPLEFND